MTPLHNNEIKHTAAKRTGFGSTSSGLMKNSITAWTFFRIGYFMFITFLSRLKITVLLAETVSVAMKKLKIFFKV